MKLYGNYSKHRAQAAVVGEEIQAPRRDFGKPNGFFISARAHDLQQARLNKAQLAKIGGIHHHLLPVARLAYKPSGLFFPKLARVARRQRSQDFYLNSPVKRGRIISHLPNPHATCVVWKLHSSTVGSAPILEAA